ncbi:cytosolic phospholipase A2 gamma-like protein [Labeo rohita]|uniref:Cytosolic phospholipase A2 gamma-like protein n=1 Tax=Labeo rohita TaxID=84645 RepID=A0A498N782_LABRO|nr:cytosolic phospholipase A2 gamma-like protein [Labeo rohita]
MSAAEPQESGDVRIEHSLNRNEEEFVARRRNTVLQCLQKFNICCSQDKVPNIALLGSGGGQRAMVALLECLVQLDKAGLLDCILYLCGVSGSTWCMASLYKEPDWSTKLDTVKDKIVERLNSPGVSWTEKVAKLKKYYMKDSFSMTDLWAVLFVTSYVKEIDEQTLTAQWDQQSKDPYPIYAVIDKQCKRKEEGDPWLEVSPHEAGYSLTGAFVETSSFGSQFDNGSKKKHQPEMDMLYLQDECFQELVSLANADPTALVDVTKATQPDKPGDWRKKYGILKGPYNAENITEVMEVAGKNISNNIEKLLEQIRAVAAAK